MQLLVDWLAYMCPVRNVTELASPFHPLKMGTLVCHVRESRNNGYLWW
jgi:hypothetical protein